jgi:hypothetical protein
MSLTHSRIDCSSRTRAHLLAAVLTMVILPLLPIAVQAGVKITTETHQIADAPVPDQAQTGSIWLDGSNLRMETASGAKQSTFIFRGDMKLLWAIDKGRKGYVQLDEETVDAMGKRVTAARKQLENQLKAMPKEEREMMRKMMEGFAPGVEQQAAAIPKTLVRETAERKEIDGKKTKKVELMRGTELVGEVWLTDWKSVKIASEDFNAFREFAAFQRNLMTSLGAGVSGQYAEDGFDVFDQLDGFPLLIRRYSAGAVESETTFKTVAKETSEEKLFMLPAGYKRTDLASGQPKPETKPESKSKSE